MVKKIRGEEKIARPLHIQEIPKKYFPRKSRAKEYALDLVRTSADLVFINRKIQYSAQICAFNIRSIILQSGFKPIPDDVFKEIKEFVYHYENYCFRLYVLREKLIQFINAVIPIGYTDKEIRIRDIMVSPIVKELGILSIIELFSKDTYLSKAINDRTRMTHRIYYGEDFDHFLRPKDKMLPGKKAKEWFIAWRKQIISRSELAEKCRELLDEINHTLTEKIITYKESNLK